MHSSRRFSPSVSSIMVLFARRLVWVWMTVALLCSGLSPWSETRAEESAPASPSTPSTSLSSAPDFEGELVEGGKIRLRDLLAKGPVLLDFWATWCKPCMQELPELQKVYQKYQARGFTLLGVPSDDSRTVGKVKPLVRSRGFKFPNVLDPERKIGNAYSVRNYPTTVLISRDGRVVSVAQGYRPGDEKAMEEKIAKLLEAQGAPPDSSAPQELAPGDGQ